MNDGSGGAAPNPLTGRAGDRSDPVGASDGLAAGQWIAVGLLFVTALGVVFGGAVGAGFVDWDDVRFLVLNPIVSGSDVVFVDRLLTPTVGYFAPVTLNLQAVLWRLGDGAAWPFHLLNVLVHGGCVALVAVVARRMGARWPLALVAAAVFGFHPLVAEPVAWATGLKDVLAAALALAATLLFLGGRFKSALVVVVAAALSKPVGATVGIAWLAFLVWRRWLRPAEEDAGEPRQAEPTPATEDVDGPLPAEVVHGGAVVGGPAPGASVPGRGRWAAAWAGAVLGAVILVLGAVQHNALMVEAPVDTTGWALQPAMAFGHYVHHLAWPVQLHPMYDVDRTVGFADWHTAVGLVAMMALVALAWYARRSRGILALLLAAAAYLPTSNLLPFPRFLSDSYVYAPLAWCCVGAAVLASAASAKTRRQITAVGVVVAVVLGGLCAGQVGRWSSNVSLWGPVTSERISWAQPWLLLAQGLAADGDLSGASVAYAQFHARTDSTQYLASFGQTLAQSGRVGDAECVMVADVSRGGGARALHNLALLMVSQPAHQVRRTPEVDQAMDWALAARRAGRLRWPVELQERLAPRRTALVAQPVQAPLACSCLAAPAVAFEAAFPDVTDR